MSKINPVQASALKTPVNKPAAAKPSAAKPAASKVVAKPASKLVTAKAVVAKKPAITQVASPNAVKTAAKKAEKPKAVKEKTPKMKMERDSFTMPKTEYAQFSVLKGRLEKLGQPAKKSELIRAGLMQLSTMTDAALKAAMSKVPTIKTGRPKKK